MDILGIGVPELIFIFIIALMVLGPRRLPEYAAKAGKMVRDLRNMSQGFITEWRREIMVATRIDELEETRRELQEAKRLLQETRSDIKGETRQIAADTNQAIDQTKQAAAGAAATTPRPATAVTPPASTANGDPPSTDSPSESISESTSPATPPNGDSEERQNRSIKPPQPPAETAPVNASPEAPQVGNE